MSKIDRLVAERVMNWRTHARNTAWWVDADVETGLVPSGGVRGLTSGMDRWSPSTCIKAAWEVRAAMKQRGFWLLLIDMNDGTWHAAFKSVEPDGRCIYSSECVAICLAALRAVGAPESEIQEAMR